MKKLICKIFGHKWHPVPFTMSRDYCERCFIEKSNQGGCFVGILEEAQDEEV